MRKVEKKKAYAAAGVDIELGNRVKKGLQERVRRRLVRKSWGG